jgi:alpha-L-arabinofuranosidase
LNTRREFLAGATTLALEQAGRAADPDAIAIDPKPLFEISPYLYMQFMEPLGTTDGSVEAAWDYEHDDWRKDFVDVVADLAPGVVRFGGLFSRYYKWREGVGPPAQRPLMRNYVWGGRETNRVGTIEFVDFCRRVGAEPLMCVNFLSDGEKRFRETRGGDAQEAADWVAYARDHGHAIKFWQLGNETSYGGATTFSRDESIAHTIEFAKAMRARESSVQLIGWGDRGRGGEGYWASELVKRAGEHIDYVAIHMMGQSPRRPDTVLKGLRYESDPERAWAELLELANDVERRVSEIEEAAGKHAIAITEGHLSPSPGNANPILYEWLSAPYHARSLNIYQRHGARVKIATAADFEGNRWTVNAVMLRTPGAMSYMMPVGCIARLFKHHSGTHGVAVTSAPADLDVAASRTGNKFFLHVANLSYRNGVSGAFVIDGARVLRGRVLAIAPESPREYVSQDPPDVFRPREYALMPAPATELRWRFPARSVSVVELDTA